MAASGVCVELGAGELGPVGLHAGVRCERPESATGAPPMTDSNRVAIPAEGRTRLPVVAGEQVWRLLRTDRDGATREEVLAMVGPAMHHLLHEAGEQFASIDPWQLVVETDDQGVKRHEWRIGAARPIVAVDAQQSDLLLPKASRVLGSRVSTPGAELPTVVGQRPWRIIVRFWWRQPDSSVDYPGYAVNAVGWHDYRLTDADWLLDKAIVPAVPDPDPGADTFGEVVVPQVTASIKRAVSWGLPVLALIGVAAALIYFGPALRGRLRGSDRKTGTS